MAPLSRMPSWMAATGVVCELRRSTPPLLSLSRRPKPLQMVYQSKASSSMLKQDTDCSAVCSTVMQEMQR